MATCWSSSRPTTTATLSTRPASSRRKTERHGGFVARPCRSGSRRPAPRVVDWSRPGRPRSARRWHPNSNPGTAERVLRQGDTLIRAANSRTVTLVVAALALLGGAAAVLMSGDPRGLLVLALASVG